MEFHGKVCYHLSPKGTGFPFQEKERSCAQYGDVFLSEVQKELCAEAISLIKGGAYVEKASAKHPHCGATSWCKSRLRSFRTERNDNDFYKKRYPFAGKREHYRRRDMLTYSDTKNFTAEELGKLFASVKWESAKYPDRLVRAMKGFSTVFSAWDGDTLAGLIAAMDDGEMTAYIHYLLVAPDRQGQGVGKKLLAMTLERYRGYVRVVLHAEGKAAAFYRANGFSEMDATCMGLPL